MRFVDVVVHNLARRKLRSALTCIGIASAVATMLTLVGFSSGLERSTVEVYASRGVDLIVVRAGVTQRLTSSLNASLTERNAALPGIAAVNPSQSDVVSFGEGSLVGIPVQGWPAHGFAFDTLTMSRGRRLQAGDRWGVLLGESLAALLEKKVGDPLEIEQQPFRIIGVYTGANVYESMSAVTLLPDLQELMDRAGQVTEFQLRLQGATLADPAAVDTLREQIEDLRDDDGLRMGLSAITARRLVDSSTEMGLARAMAWGTTAIALVMGALGMLNTMLMSVLERTREIGILRALGWRTSLIVRLVMAESLTMSLVGAALGIIGGLLLTRTLSATALMGGLLRPELSPWTALLSLLLAVLIGAIGGFYPAQRAAGLSVVEALHDE